MPRGSLSRAFVPNARANRGEQPVREPEQNDGKHREEQKSPPAVLEHVVADLVPGDGAHFVERGILKRDVGDRDPRSASNSAGIGCEVVRLARAIEHVDFARRNARASRHLHHGTTHRARRHGLVLLNKGSIRTGASSIDEGKRDRGQRARPEPPALAGATHQPVDADQEHGAENRGDQSRERELNRQSPSGWLVRP